MLAAAGSDIPPGPRTTMRSPSPRALAGLTLFVVDDDASIREAMREVLEDAGAVVHCAAGGRSAIDSLKAGFRPHLVLLDLMMPDVNGADVWHWMQGSRETQAIAVLVVSAAGVLPPSLGRAPVLRKGTELHALVDAVCDTIASWRVA